LSFDGQPSWSCRRARKTRAARSCARFPWRGMTVPSCRLPSGSRLFFAWLGAASSITAGGAPALENEAEHHNEEGRGDRIVQAIILCDGVDDFHGTPDLKTGNPVAANSFPVLAIIF